MTAGMPNARSISSTMLRRYCRSESMAVRIHPEQPAYQPESIISGVSRPYARTNLWRSDPAQKLPQWIQLAWNEPVSISEIRLTFDGNIEKLYHEYKPFHKDPLCVKKYSIEADVNGSWKEVASVDGNYHRHRIHKLDKEISVKSIRILCHETWGDPSAALYEVRVY